MDVKSFTKKEKSTAEVIVEVSAEEFETAVNKAYLSQRGKISIPGFRKGKAPRKIIENLYGPEVFYEDAIEQVYPTAAYYGANQSKLQTVDYPSVVDTKINDDKSLVLTFLFSLYPEVTLSDYKGVVAPRPSDEVTDEDVEKQINQIRKQNARIESADHEVRTGNIAVIDCEGFIDDVPVEDSKMEDYYLEIGEGTFIPGFEEQLVGAKAGDNLEVNVTFPEAYAPDIAGKDAVFKVTVKDVKEVLLPDADDDFAMDVSEFDTFDEYYSNLKESMKNQKKQEADDAFHKAILDKLVEKSVGDVPDVMIDKQVEDMMENIRYNVTSQGMEFDDYLKMLGESAEDLKTTIRPAALTDIKENVLIWAVANAENIEVDDERLEEEYKKLSEKYGIEIDDIKKQISADSLRDQIKMDSAADLIFSAAVIENIEKDAEDSSNDSNEESDAADSHEESPVSEN